jgi:hypothetical protein
VSQSNAENHSETQRTAVTHRETQRAAEGRSTTASELPPADVEGLLDLLEAFRQSDAEADQMYAAGLQNLQLFAAKNRREQSPHG